MKNLKSGFFSLYILIVSFLAIFTTSCSADLETGIQQDDITATQISEDQALDTIGKSSKVKSSSIISKIQNAQDFARELSKYNINLSPNDLDLMKKTVNVIPTGQWTPGPEGNPQVNLKGHFLKHGGDFTPPFKNENDYLKSAINAAKSIDPNSNYYLDINPYKESKIISVIKWNSKTFEFTVVRLNGQIATYFLNNKLRADRFFLIPNDLRNIRR